jgi:hypothetical protein
MPGLSILRVVSNTEIDRVERERMDAEVQARQNSEPFAIRAALKFI